jgi:carboxypeptidase family protein
MTRLFVRTAAALVVSLLGCTHAWAQATAQISGGVKDQSGAVLPGVDVTATQTATGIVRNTVTDETGSYILSNLPLGPYRLEVALSGFRTFVQTGIVLQVNANPVINAVLQVGALSETVSVEANAAMIETRSPSVSQVIENERILELPLNGRQVTDLVSLGGGAVQVGLSSNQSMQGGVRISVAGGQSFGIAYTLDGAMHTNPYDGANLPLPFPDALQEIEIESSGLSASNPMKSGGAVNAVTKSGTNLFHGSGFEFFRNHRFNADNFFAQGADTLSRNQFGGTLGGPVVQNRLFFFGAYQGTITRSNPGDTIRFVPTPAMLRGDFTTIASAGCNAGRAIALRAPFVDNRIDPALFSRAAANLAAKLPAAQDECGRITYGVPQQTDESQAVGKVDYQLTANHSLFGRYMATTYDIPPAYRLAPDNVLTTTNAGLDNLAQSVALGDTLVLGNNAVNALRVTVNRTALARIHQPSFNAPSLGVGVHSMLSDFLVLGVTGGFNIGGNTQSLATFVTNSYQVSEDLNLVRGNHQFAVGGNVALWKVDQFAVNQDTGNFMFNGQATGLGLADFMLGRVSSFQQGSPTDWASRQTYLGLYAQDAWRLSSRVTLNYGLRWEPFLPLHLVRGAVYGFDAARFQQGTRSTVVPNAPLGLYYEGDSGFPEGAAVNRRWMQFGPRVGFAWDMTGDGRTSMRGYYGIAYDFSAAQNLGNSASAPPHAFRVQLTSPAGGFDNPWQGIAGGNPFPYQSSPNNAVYDQFGNFLPVMEYDMEPPQVHSWNLSLQRQLGTDLMVSATYMGNQATHLWVQRSLNPAVFIPGGPCTIAGVVYNPCSSTTNTNQRRTLHLQNPAEGRFYGIVDALEDGGTQNYNGLLLSVQRRSARGLTLGGNYTWSHCIGDNTVLGNNANINNAYVDPSNRDFDRGNCESDRRHTLNLTGVVEMPGFDNSTLRAIATGWRVAGIYRQSSGSFMTILSGQDRALTGAGGQRAQQLLEDPFLDRDGLNYLNPAAFVQPTLGTLGNMGRNNIEGPGNWQVDLALSRVFPVGGTRLEARVEAFNLTNNLIRRNPTANFSQNTFGQIIEAGDPRIMQFAVKYVF